jgi:hypothetical protein
VADMFLILAVTSAQQEQPKQRKYESFQEYSSKFKTDEQKKEEVCRFVQQSFFRFRFVVFAVPKAC